MNKFVAVFAAIVLASPAYAGPAVPGPAQSQSALVGCIYTSAGVTLTDTNNQAALQCNSTGQLITSGSGGGGGGAATIADGADVTQGAKADTVCATSTGTCTVTALIKKLNTLIDTLNTNVTSPVPAGTNTVGGTTPVASATGGATPSTVISAATTNATNLKGSAGTLYHLAGYGNTATPAYLSLYNTAGTPTCGTGIVYEMLIPSNSTSGAGAVEDFGVGLNFSTGIGYCITTAAAGTGSVALGANIISFSSK